MAGTSTTTIELLKKYNFPIQKKYGQNFLIDDNILSGIVSAAQVEEADTVLEIGPGLGALTGILCRTADKGRVIAVEIDKMLIPILQETLQDYSNLTIINEDILKVDIDRLATGEMQGTGHVLAGAASETERVTAEKASETKVEQVTDSAERLKVVANLPYYITTPIIMELLEKADCIRSITVMIQKEVAERMQEGPGSKSYGALSLAAQFYAKPQYIMTVSRNCFIPKPDVDSAVIRLDLYEKDERPVRPEDPDKMFRIIRAAFNQRRKTLVNSLSNAQNLTCSKPEIIAALQQMDLPETVRGEALTLEQFARLSDLL